MSLWEPFKPPQQFPRKHNQVCHSDTPWPSSNVCPRVFTSMVKHHDHQQPGEEMAYFGLQLSGHTTLQRSTILKQELGSSGWCRHHGGVLITGLLPTVYSASFLRGPRITSPKVTSGPSHISHQLRKCIPGFPQVNLLGVFPQLRFTLM